ncbi:hypothetical protein ABIA35_002316 [Catenulispora sp. MAP12-49]|uniref:competence protein CoiA family protein n=1 Tax=Catenulispora sp. MAP12-49 TaxID=3156302 RepID=UPI00351143B6
MTQTVWHAGYRIAINLSLDDLGHPDRPGLWEEIYKPDPSRPRLLRCMAIDDDDGTECPEAMYILVRDGLRIASHWRSGAKPHRNEGPKHKALKERIANVAQRAGFAADVEDVSADGTRRTDVLVGGGDGGPIGWEIQFSHITGPAAIKRTATAKVHGITPMWTVDHDRSQVIDRGPWNRLDKITDWRQIAGKQLNVRGGVRTLRMERCQKGFGPCPVKKRGSCGDWHGVWLAARGVYLDSFVAETAAGEYVPLYRPATTRRGGNYMWVTPVDKAEFLQDRTEVDPYAGVGTLETEPGDCQVPKPIDPRCHYGEPGKPATKRAPRDTGDRIAVGEWLTRAFADGPGVGVTDPDRVPDELVRLQLAFLRADAECERISAALPSSLDVVAGLAVIDAQQRVDLEVARAERLEVVLAKYEHPWWGVVANRYEADVRLRAVVQERVDRARRQVS